MPGAKLPRIALCPEPRPQWLRRFSLGALCCALLSGLLAVFVRTLFPRPADQWYVHGLKAELAFVCQQPAEGPCAAAWLPFEGRCYQYLGGPSTYVAARDECTKLGGTLASIHSQSQNDFVHALCDDGGDLPCTIGLRRAEASSEDWEWEDGSAFNYTNWASPRLGGDSWETAALGVKARASLEVVVLGHCANILFMALSVLLVVCAYRLQSSCFLQCSLVTNGIFSASCVCLGILALLVIGRDPARSVPEFLLGLAQLLLMLCLLATRFRMQDDQLPGQHSKLTMGSMPPPQVISGE